MCIRDSLYTFKQFEGLTIDKRKEFLIKNKCCFNCLRVGHSVNECKNKHTCKIFSKKHHSLIHTGQGTYCALKLKINRNILLSTALCKTLENSGKPRLCRILLDSGSQANFITQAFAKKLKLNLVKNELTITGINNASCRSHHLSLIHI